jgi:3-deoxy-D-manno-octulosonate 8-phosphate phosphatase (KDO 8-P phosphatase)
MKNYNITLVVYDFDGVMTDNKVYIDQTGNEMVQVSRADGLGISKIKEMNIEQIILSSETNTVVSARAQKLGLFCLQGVSRKEEALKKYCEKNKFKLNNVAFLGNDINDFQAMELVKYRFSPSDAHSSIKNISTKVFKSKGGDGVIRELYDLLNKKEGE